MRSTLVTVLVFVIVSSAIAACSGAGDGSGQWVWPTSGVAEYRERDGRVSALFISDPGHKLHPPAVGWSRVAEGWRWSADQEDTDVKNRATNRILSPWETLWEVVQIAAFVVLGGVFASVLVQDRQKKAHTAAMEAVKADFAQRLEVLAEISPKLRVLKVANGVALTVRFALDPTSGRIRIDWVIKPDVVSPLRVEMYAGEKHLSSDVHSHASYSAVWGPGEYLCRLEAFAPDQPQDRLDHVSYLFVVPPPEAAAPDEAARVEKAMAEFAKKAGTARFAQYQAIRTFEEQLEADGVPERDRQKLVNTVRAATSELLHELLSK